MAAIDHLRSQVTNYEVYLEGDRMLGTATVDLPELKFLTAEISGAGITGKIDMPTMGHTESIEVTLNWINICPNLMNVSSQRSLDLALYGAQHVYNHGTGDNEVEQVKIELRGLNKSTTLGKFEPATTTDSKTVLEIVYLKLSIGGKRMLELDKLNFVYFAYDKDHLAATRTALGLSDSGLLEINVGF